MPPVGTERAQRDVPRRLKSQFSVSGELWKGRLGLCFSAESQGAALSRVSWSRRGGDRHVRRDEGLRNVFLRSEIDVTTGG